jgi:hypothetical protein
MDSKKISQGAMAKEVMHKYNYFSIDQVSCLLNTIQGFVRQSIIIHLNIDLAQYDNNWLMTASQFVSL